MNAKVMLVCDKDIMEIDISNMTTAVCETLLVTAIVCDWNVRAWTFLEAFRARRTIHLLCRDNAVVQLKQVIEVVHRKGALDIGILLLAMPHFLPALDDRILASPKTWAPEGRREGFKAGYLPIETSGSLLTHRAASRPGDDFVIWSLLMSDKTIFYSAEAFWKSMQGLAYQTSVKRPGAVFSSAASIKIGYLVSSAPRLKTKGLGWAPASPASDDLFLNKPERNHIDGFDGGPSEAGYITTDGLVADWLLCKITGTGFFWSSMVSSIAAAWRFHHKHSPPPPHESQFPRNLAIIRARFLQGYRWGAILWPIQKEEFGGKWWEDGTRTRRTTLVVCGSNEIRGEVLERFVYNSSVPTRGKWDENREAAGWEWRGIYVWDDAEDLPRWVRARKLLIV